MEKFYKTCRMETNGFKQLPEADAQIIKVMVVRDDEEKLFVFILNGIDCFYFKNNEINPIDIIFNRIEGKIDDGLTNNIYFFELRNGEAEEVINPIWWIGTKQK